MKMLGTIATLMIASLFATFPLVANEADVRQTLSNYVDVFNQKEASKMGEFWTENGTHTDRETGQRTEGREAIQADMTEVLSEQRDIKLSATIDQIRFITPDVASVEGETTVVLGDESEPIIGAFIAILVHQGDKWLLDSIEEMSLPEPPSSTTALKELEWLIGDWVDDSGETSVATTFRWTANQAFLLRSFDVQTQDGVAMTGTQVIGWDPVVQQIRSWSFNSDGSFGQSTWTRTGDQWLSKSVHTLASGEVASGTYVMQRLDDDAFTIQLVGHEVGGQPQPSGPSVKVVRVKPQPVSTSAPQN